MFACEEKSFLICSERRLSLKQSFRGVPALKALKSIINFSIVKVYYRRYSASLCPAMRDYYKPSLRRKTCPNSIGTMCPSDGALGPCNPGGVMGGRNLYRFLLPAFAGLFKEDALVRLSFGELTVGERHAGYQKSQSDPIGKLAYRTGLQKVQCHSDCELAL